MEFRYQVGDDIKIVRVERAGGDYRITVGGRTYTAAILQGSFSDGSGELAFSLDGQNFRAAVAVDGSLKLVALGRDVFTIATAEPGRKHTRADTEINPIATMHAQVVSVLVAEGDAVTCGHPLAVLEAMKMEIRITAPRDGRVCRVLCQPGQVVERGQMLFDLGD